MKIFSRLSYLFMGLLFVFLSSDAIAGTCDNCAACNNDIKIVNATFKVQKVIDNYQCFKSGDKYVLNFVAQVNFEGPSQPIVIDPNEGHVLEINNLNLAEAEGVDKDLFLIISGSNVSINNSILTGGGIEITSSNVSISGGTVGAITIASSASDVVISNTDIASSGGTGIDVAGQDVTITGPDFIGDIVAPILLAEGANANVKPPDVSKVFRKMSEDDTVVKEIVGIVDDQGEVELFKRTLDGENKKILFEKKCPVSSKKDTNYSNSEKIDENSKMFICSDINFVNNDYISLTFTGSNGDSSEMTESIKLADKGKISTNAPPVTLPAPITGGVSDDGDKPDDTVINFDGPGTVAISGGAGGSDEGSAGRGCAGSIISGTSGCGSSFAYLFILFPVLSTMIVRRFM